MTNTIEQLNERIHLFELVNDSSIDGIIVYDTELRVIYWNKASEHLVSVSREEALGNDIYHVFPNFKENTEIVKGLTNALKGRKVFIPYEQTGTAGPFHEYHFIPLKSEDDNLTGILHLVHDMAHRIKAENELKALNKSLVRKNKELKSKNAELQSFSQVTGLGLDEPLHKIYRFAEMLVNDEGAALSDNARSYLKRIQGSAQRMRMLANDLHQYYETSNQKLTTAKVDLNNLLLRLSYDFGEKADLKSILQVPEKLPVIKGNHTALLELFKNMISNAIRFHRKDVEPCVTITAKVVSSGEINNPEATESSYIRIDFEDNGIGFDEKHKDKIFDIFYRIHNNAYPGTGIGLAICKKIAEMHHGFITADTAPGSGSIFHVFLPYNLPRETEIH